MKLVEKFWLRLQKNIIPILFLMIFHAWMTVMFPGHSFLGKTGNLIMQIFSLIIGVFCLIWLFIINNNDIFAFDWFLNAKDSFEKYLAWFRVITFAIVYALATCYAFKKGFFNYSKLYYIMMNAEGILTYYFLYQAAHKRKKDTKC